MEKNVLATALGAVAIIGVLAWGASMYTGTPVTTTPPTNIPPSGAITVEGTLVCLPHKNPGEVQTMECAYGIRNSAGTYFALSDTDPTYKNIASAPMNTRVRAEGTFAPRTDSNYQDIGIISVTKITEVKIPGSSTGTSTPQQLSLKLNQSGTTLDVTLTPKEVLEDSRCPINVVCIQAGTVRLRATLTSGLGTGDQIFKLGETTTTEAENITLVRVEPSTTAGQEMNKNSYVFHFEISKR